MIKMQTTVCAYCDHEVKITPDGVCLFCGGNLAEEPFDEIKLGQEYGFDTDFYAPYQKSRIERIQDVIEPSPERLKRIRKFLMGDETEEPIEINLESIKRTLEAEEQKRRESQAKKEMRELDNMTKIVAESETVKALVKSLDKSIIPFWLKFGAFLLGLIISAFFVFPDIQIPLLETLKLINSSPYVILVMSFIPILFLLIMIRKFDRSIF